MSVRETSLKTIASRPLRSSLARARSIASAPCSAANPTSVWSALRSDASVGEDVLGLLEPQLEPAAPSREIFPGSAHGRPKVGDRGGHQAARGCRELVAHRARELGGRLDVDAADARGLGKRHVGGDQADVGAAARGALRQRQPHPSAGAVADEAHGVDRLARAAGGDENAQAVPRPGGGGHERLDLGQQPLGRRQPPDAVLAARGERALVGLDHPHPALAQASPGSPGWRRPRTCGRSSPARRRAARCRRGTRSSASSRRSRRRAWRSCSPTPARPGTRRRWRRPRGGRSGRGRAADRPGRRRAAGRARTRRSAPARRRSPRTKPRPRSAVAAGVISDPHAVAGAGREPRELERLVGGDPAAYAEQDAGHRGGLPPRR